MASSPFDNPEFIVIDPVSQGSREYPGLQIQDKARVPVIALDYEDRHKAVKKELIIDYKAGGLYVVDAEDRTILHDLSKLIADNYLANINGNDTFVTIEGIGVVNLATILKLLYQSRIDLLNQIDDTTPIPAGVSFDNKSIVIANNLVEVYGFHSAKPLSTPRVSEDGERIEWVGGVEDERPGGDMDNVNEPPGGFEPPLGAIQNVLYIYPTDDVIILYNKPQQFTDLTTRTFNTFKINTPKTMMQYATFKWRLDSKVAINLVWDDNLVWITPKVSRITPITSEDSDSEQQSTELYKYPAIGFGGVGYMPVGSLPFVMEESNIRGVTYVFEFTTWDYGNTWMVKYIAYNQDDNSIIQGELPDWNYFTHIEKNGTEEVLTTDDGHTVFTYGEEE